MAAGLIRLIRLIRFYTLPPGIKGLNIRRATTPLSHRPNCGCEPAVLQDVASVTGPEGPPNAFLCVSAERSRDQPVCTVAACCHVQAVLRRSAVRRLYRHLPAPEGAMKFIRAAAA